METQHQKRHRPPRLSTTTSRSSNAKKPSRFFPRVSLALVVGEIRLTGKSCNRVVKDFYFFSAARIFLLVFPILPVLILITIIVIISISRHFQNVSSLSANTCTFYVNPRKKHKAAPFFLFFLCLACLVVRDEQKSTK